MQMSMSVILKMVIVSTSARTQEDLSYAAVVMVLLWEQIMPDVSVKNMVSYITRSLLESWMVKKELPQKGNPAPLVY